MTRVLAGGSSALLAGFLVGCGQEEQPRWTEIATAGEHVTPSLEIEEHVLADGRTVRLAAEGGGVRLELPLSRADWTRQVPPSFWLAQLPLPLPVGDHTNSTVHLEATTPGVRYVNDGKIGNLGSNSRSLVGTWIQGTQTGEVKITRH